MTNNEARKVCDILVKADTACTNCASALVEEFLEGWPQFRAEAKLAWEAYFDWTKFEEYFPTPTANLT